MTSMNCLLQKIYNELKKMNRNIAVRTNAIAVIEIDTNDTSKRSYNIEKTFNSPKGIIATQLTIIDLGGGFNINVNNSGSMKAVYGYSIENEEINDIEIKGNGVVGTARIRLGATI